MQTRDKEINKILNRAEEYRKRFQKNEEKVVSSKLNVDFGEIFNKFFYKLDDTDENNVFIKYKIKKADIKNGIIKNLKYTIIDKNNRKITKIINIKLPKQLLKKSNNCIFRMW